MTTKQSKRYRRGNILYHNGLGYQASEDDLVFALWIDQDIPESEIESIRQSTGAKTLKQGSFIGRDYLQVDWEDED